MTDKKKTNKKEESSEAIQALHQKGDKDKKNEEKNRGKNQPSEAIQALHQKEDSEKNK